MIEKWQNLLAQLETIENEGLGIWSEERLLAFEAKTGITLPADYKYFCQVFGLGMFCNYWRISLYPDKKNSRKEMLLTEIDELSDSVASPTMDKISLKNLVTNALIFGNTVNSHLMFWDLRTYSERDRSYDIYFGDIIYADVYQVGRNFFEFVRDFCLGMKSYEVLPEWMYPDPQELTPYSFYSLKSPFELEFIQLEEET
ncbi:MAG: SMI1/KNR4 family protein [Cyanobacteriota bacterium]|nr:SMI1/KNR4 family protein [Cyanobacteriota bacterium]